MYTVKLNNFEGPLDLLLFFIRRDELNIYDIPISQITKEFLGYVRLMELFDLELAGEFLVMASTLMHIKTQMLLPREEKMVNGELIEDDPRAELVQKLLEYKQFKDASQNFSAKFEEQRYAYYRQMFEADAQSVQDAEPIKNATLFDLLRALKKALERKPQAEPNSHIIQRVPVTVEEKTEFIAALLRTQKKLRFFELIEGVERIHIVVTFLALLELAKNHLITIQQDEAFDDIAIVAPEHKPEIAGFSLN